MVEDEAGGNTENTLVCRVRYQAELIGILTQINTLNLPLLNVNYVQLKP
jgi:hypothetical protein